MIQQTPGHESILIAVVVLGVPNIVIACFYIFQHKLLWRDYVKRKNLNGGSRDDV